MTLYHFQASYKLSSHMGSKISPRMNFSLFVNKEQFIALLHDRNLKELKNANG